MIPRLLPTVAFACIAVLGSVSVGQTQETDTDLTQKAETLVSLFHEARYKEAVADFDATMQRLLNEPKLAEAWKSVEQQFGPFQAIEQSESAREGKYLTVRVLCRFSQSKVTTRIVFDDQSRVAGLFFSGASVYRTPDYAAAPEAIDEFEVSIGKGFFRLSGTLTVPKSREKPPVVILVHGSGPQDRDETIGPNKPFRDLSLGLAAEGIAVLRYEKRTKQHPLALVALGSSLTVQEETIHDAVAAVELMSDDTRVDSSHIYVLGHSLGGYLIPRIADQSPKARGFIALAASARPLEDLIEEQTKTILELDGEWSDEDAAAFQKIKQQCDLVRSTALSKQTSSSDLPLGIPAAYWLDLRDYRPHEKALAIDRPFLMLQGDRDYQVTMPDWNLWKGSLETKMNVKLRLFADLNHLFMTGERPSRPAEYNAPGHVAKDVISEIAGWIQSDSK